MADRKSTQEDEDNHVMEVYMVFKSLDSGFITSADALLKKSVSFKDMAPDSDPMADYRRLHRKLDKANGPKALSSLIKRYMKSKNEEIRRSAKNYAFSYKDICLEAAEVTVLEAWLLLNKDIKPLDILVGPEIKGMSLKAAKNFIGYHGSDRMNMNKGYLRMLVIKYQDSGSLLADDKRFLPELSNIDEDLDDDKDDLDATEIGIQPSRDRGLTTANEDLITKIIELQKNNEALTDSEIADLKLLLKYKGDVVDSDKKLTKGAIAIIKVRFKSQVDKAAAKDKRTPKV